MKSKSFALIIALGVFLLVACSDDIEVVLTDDIEVVLANDLGEWCITEIVIASGSDSTENQITGALVPGENVTVILDKAGAYDIMIIDENGDFYTRSGIEIGSEGYRWEVTLSDMDDSGQHIMTDRPTDPLVTLASENGWYDRRRNAIDEYNVLLRSENWLRSSLLESGQLNDNLNNWQRTSGWDPGWSNFLDNVSDKRAAFVDTGNFIMDYNRFSQALYEKDFTELSNLQLSYINTYARLYRGERSLTYEEHEAALYEELMDMVTSNIGLSNEDISNVALYGIYQQEIARLDSEIESATETEKTLLLTAKSEFITATEYMILQDPAISENHNNSFNDLVRLVLYDELIQIAADGSLQE